MKLEGERKLPGRPQQIWEMLLDPDVLVSAMPGCENLDRVSEDHYEGRINAKVGSIQSTYNATFKITDKNPPESYVLNVKGRGSAGFVQGDVHMQMDPDGSDHTMLSFSGDVNVGGRIAQVGQRMIRATATAMIDQGFEDLRDRVQQEIDVQAAEAAGAAGTTSEGGTATATRSTTQTTKRTFGDKVKRFFRFIRTFFKAFFSGGK
jgi:carbon monoxide dehydrogenase subunit G